MPVAIDQITEIVAVLLPEIEEHKLLKVIRKMKRTKAYRRNSSFRITIDRVIEQMERGTVEK